MSKSRLDRLNSLLRKSKLDGAVLNPGPTLTYLTGVRFHLMERPVVLLVAPDRSPALVLPELEMAKVGQIPYEVLPFPYPEDPLAWDAAYVRAVQALGLDGKQIGLEPRSMRLLEFRYVKAAAPEAGFPDASEALGELRLRKDSHEIEAMRKAVQIAQEALTALLPQVKVGMTERDLAGELVVQLLRHGSDSEMPLTPIVSAGPNSANPHASPTERKIQRGDFMLFDWGATFGGYISDLTRTYAIGEIEPELKKIHSVVQEANAAGCAAARPGSPCSAVDAAARAVIEKAGYGRFFTHRTGHGIGMEVHEDPYMRSDNAQILEPGMAFTVEPGIYLPDRNGVRIEDNVVITESGVDVLSDMPRDLSVLG